MHSLCRTRYDPPLTTQYETLRHEATYREAFGVEPPAALGERLLWPRKPG